MIVKINPTVRARVTEKLVERVEELDLTPLEVMLKTMKIHFSDGTELLKASDAARSEKTKEKARLRAKYEYREASAIAKDVAPYIHAKIQTITLKGDASSPLEIALGLMDAESLRAVVRGKK